MIDRGTIWTVVVVALAFILLMSAGKTNMTSQRERIAKYKELKTHCIKAHAISSEQLACIEVGVIK